MFHQKRVIFVPLILLFANSWHNSRPVRPVFCIKLDLILAMKSLFRGFTRTSLKQRKKPIGNDIFKFLKFLIIFSIFYSLTSEKNMHTFGEEKSTRIKEWGIKVALIRIKVALINFAQTRKKLAICTNKCRTM